MDTLSIPSRGGVDTTALIVGVFSNGNDAIITKGGGDLTSLNSKSVNLVELSVSHYLLVRGQNSVDLPTADLPDALVASLISPKPFFEEDFESVGLLLLRSFAL